MRHPCFSVKHGWIIYLIFAVLNMPYIFTQNAYQLTGDAINAINGGFDCYRLTPNMSSQAGGLPV